MACEGITIETTALDEVIEVGVVGPQGPSGAAGVGVPTGGITGYVLAKASTADYDTEWVEQTGGGGDFSSPPPIGDVTPNTGAFTTLTAVTGNFTTISASGLATLPHIHGSLAGNLYIHVKNTSGGALSRGTPVYITGNVGATDRVEVAAADFDDSTKMPAVGLLEQDLAQNGTGDAVIVGELANANTAAYSLHQELFVGNNGTLTGAAPITGEVQSVGIVSRAQSNTGVIVVNMQGRRSPNSAFAAATHAASHAAEGSDPVFDQDLNTTNSVTFNEVSTDNNLIVGGDLTIINALVVGANGVLLQSATSDTTLTTLATEQREVSLPDASGTLALTTTAPASHAASHAAGGSDPVFDQDLNTTDSVTFNDGNFQTFTTVELSVTGEAGISFENADGRVNTRANLGLGPAATQDFASPPAIGSTTPAAGTFTTLSANTLSANNGTLTASAPVLNLAQTWNNGSVNFTAVRINVTNTASQFSGGQSNLLDLQVGGGPAFFVRTNGNANASGFTTFGGGALSLNGQAILVADASNALAQRSGTNAQTFNIYNTFTNASNHERGFMRWSSNVLQIGTEKAGTGSARALELQTDGTSRWQITTAGLLTTVSAPADAGGLSLQGGWMVYRAGSTNHWAIVSGDITQRASGNFQWSGQSDAANFSGDWLRLSRSAGGCLLLSAGTSTEHRLQFGGTTTSFPALKRSSTVLQARLANDSDFCPLQGQLRIHQNAVAETPTATHTMTLFDAAGTAYKVLCVAA